LLSVTDRAGETTSYTYYLDGTLRSITLPPTAGEPNRSLFFTYVGGPGGPLLASLTDAQGNVTRFNYNFTFDIFGRVTGGTTRVTDAAGNVTSYTFDGNGNITDVKDAQGNDTLYTYDANQNLTRVVDANGSAILRSDSTYFRNLRQSYGVVDASGQGKLVANLTAAEKTALQAHFATNITYDANGNVTSRTDGAGNLTTYTYTAFNKVATTTSADGNALVSSDDPLYIAKRQELGIVSATGAGKTVAQLTAADKQALLALYTTVYSYDTKQNIAQIQSPGGDLTRLSYDANGNLVQKTVFLDATNLTDTSKQEVTSYFYDAFGNNTKTIDAQGNTTLATYDHFGNRLTSVDGNGGVTTNTFDAENRLVSTTDALGNTIRNFYDAVGNRIAVQDASGHTVTYVYSANNLLLTVIDPAANPAQAATLTRTSRYTYDVVGNETSLTDANGNATTYAYDALNRVVKVTTPTVTDASGNAVNYFTTYEYDGIGNRITSVDDNGNRTDTVYNSNNLVRQVTDASGHVTQYAYDADLNQVSIVIGAELAPSARQILKFDFDTKGRKSSETDALGNTQKYTYDGANNQISFVDADGNTTTYAYDRDNRLLTQTNAAVADSVSGQPVNYTIRHQYDANGNQIAVTDQNGHTTQTSFDKDNRVALVQDGNGNKTVYTYDSRGNRTSIQIGVQAHVNTSGQVVVDSTANAQVETFTYDEFNQVVSKTDGVGNALVTSDSALYTQMRQQLGIVSSSGQGKTVAQLTASDILALKAQFTEKYTYDRVGNYTSTTDHLGRTTSFTYDALHRLVSTTDALGQISTAAYDGNGNAVTRTDALGRKTTLTYDSLNRLVDSANALGVHTHNVYDSFGNLITSTEAFGTSSARTSRYVYDLDNRMISRADALGNTQSYSYDAVGNRLQVTDAKGQTTRYVYDALNRNVAVIDPLGLQTRFVYDGVGNRISLIDAKGGVTKLTYDGVNHEIQLVDALGRVTTYTFDALGNRLSQTTASGTAEQETTTYLYDAEGHLRQVTDAAGNVTTQGYDADYNQTSTTDAKGNTTVYSYDALNREIKVTDALGAITKYAYDAVGNRLTMTDANNHATTYAYDAANRLITSTDANGVATAYAYDAVGNRISITQAANTALAATQTFTYDLDDRLVSQTDADGNTQTNQYDADGNKIAAVDALGHTTAYAFDADSRVTSITDALGNVTQYRYDANGNRVQVVDPRGFVTTSYFDSDNEVILSVDNNGYATSFAYDHLGNITSQTLFSTPLSLPVDPATLPTPAVSASDRTTSIAYDKLNRVISRTDGEGFVTQYSYDAVGNQTQIRRALDRAATQFEVTNSYFDAVHRRIAQVSPQGYLTTYHYDAVGNLASQTSFDQIVSIPSDGGIPQPVSGDVGRTTSYGYDGDNRLILQTNALGVATSYGYDAKGNRTSMTEAVGTSDARTTTYAYDAADRYIQTTNAIGVSTRLDLDADGNVLARHEAFGTPQERVTRFTYDGNNQTISETDPLGVVTQKRYDAAGNLISQTVAAGTSAARTATYAYDGDNRQISAVDPTGATTTYSYDAAGNRTGVTQAVGLPEARTNSFVYDRANRLVSATDALGVVTQYQYDGVGNKLATIQAAGTTQQRKTSYSYDLDDRLTRVTDPVGAVTQFQYDAQGNQTRITDANGGVQVNTFDALGHLVSGLSAAGVLTHNTYDRLGNVVSTTQSFADGSDARTSTYAYDLLNRQTGVTDGEGFSTTIAYDAFGNQVSITHGQYLVSSSDPNYSAAKAAQALPQTSTFVYDAHDRMLSMTDALGIVTSYQYDVIGNRTSTTDGNGNATQYTYDLLNRLTQTTTPEGGITRYAYDHVGNRIAQDQLQSGDAATGVWAHTTYQYDAGGRQVSQTDPLGIVSQWTYDAMGNVLSQTSAAGTSDSRTVHMEYDLDNRKIADVDALGNRTTYAYDANGNRIKATDPLGHVAHFYFDAANQLQEVVDPQGFVNTFSHDAAGNLTKTIIYMTPITGVINDHVAPAPVASSADRITTEQYDRANRLISETAPDGSIKQFTYDAAGNKTSDISFANTSAPRTRSYSYDADNRLLTFVDVDGSVTTFAYDKANNRISQTITSSTDPNHTRNTTFAYDANNRQISQTFDPLGLDIVESSTFDHLGNALTKTDGDGHTTTFTYDLDNRQLSQVDALGNTQTFGYDRVGNKTSQTDARGNTTNFVYDAKNRLVQEIQPSVEIYTVSGGFSTVRPTTTHVYDANGNEIQTTDANGSVTTRYFDGDSREIAEVNADNALTTYTYDAAGDKTSQTLYMTRLASADPSVVPQPPAGATQHITYAYDSMGRLTVTTYPPAQISTLVNGNTSSPSTVTSTQQVTERKVYDPFGNLVESVDKNGNPSFNYYDVKGNKIAAVDAGGYLTQWDYDQQGNILHQRVYTQPLDVSTLTAGTPPAAPAGDVYLTDFQYDAASRVVQEVTPQISVFDPNTQTSSQLRSTTVFTYDKAGNQLTKTAGAGSAQAVTEYSYYDAANRKVAVISSGRVLATYGYDANGNLVSQKRFINPVAGSVDLTRLSGSTDFGALVVHDAGHDEESDFTFNALNLQTQQTDVINSGNTRLTKRSAYDAVSNKTYTQDEDAFVTQASYDGMGRIVQSISPDGSGTQYQYDAAGNRILIYTGVITGGAPTPATNVSASLGSQVTLAWNTQGSNQHPLQTWVVYDTSSHQNVSDYAHRSTTQVSTNGQGQAALSSAATGSTIFFRVVTQDGAGNQTWTAEQSMTIPPRFSDVSVAEPDSSTIVVTAHFDAGVTAPHLLFGSSGNLSQSADFVLQSDGSYKATLSGLTDPASLSFALQWKDAAGNSYQSSQGTFAASADQVGVTSSVSQNQIVNASGTAYTVSVNTSVPSAYAAGLTTLQAQWRLAGSGAAFAATAVSGTSSGQGSVTFSAVLGDTTNLAPGTYEIVLEGVRADGTAVELDHFNFTVGTTGTSVTRSAISWIAPNVGNDQLVIIDGQNSASTRDAGRIVVTDGDTNPSADYEVLYGTSSSATHTVNVTSAADTVTQPDPSNPSGPPITVITGYDVGVQATLSAGETANIGSGGLHLSWRAAGSGADFSNDVVLSSSGANSFSTTLANLAAGHYDLKIYYVDAQGNQVVVEWQRIDAATANETFSGRSLTVLAQENGGTISTNAQGVIAVKPGVYTGTLDVGALSRSLSLSLTNTGNAGGSLKTDGRATGYFAEIQYNSLNYKTASNEGDGLWRQYAVDGNGNQVETDLLGDRSSPDYNPSNFIATYAEYDARNRKVASFGAPVAVGGSTTLTTPVDRYTYNVLDKVTSHTDALGNTTQYVFNALGTQTESIDPFGQTSQNLVDQFGNTTATITQLGHTTLSFYDLQGRMTKQQDAMGNVTTYTYDAFDRKLTQADALGNTTRYFYDQRDRLQSVIDPLGNSETFGYDGRNNRVSTVNPLGQETDQVYDGLSRVIDTITFLNGQAAHAQSAYDAYGNLISETDQMGRSKAHVYGPFGRLLQDIDEDGNVISYQYDVFGRRTNAFDPNAVSNPNATTDPSGGKDIQTSYNEAGQITSVRDLATGVSTTYQYDLLGHRTNEVITTPGDVADRNTSYEYDALGQMVRWKDSVTGDNLNTQYDAEGNVAREFTDNGYDPLSQNTDGNPNFRYIDHVYTYDADRRVTQESQRTTDASGHATDAIINGYTYDAASNRLTWNNAGTVVTYTYDADGRVREGDFFTGSDSNQQKWTYDSLGNVLTFNVLKNGSQTSSTVNTYNDANRVLTTNKDGEITTNTYDLSQRITRTVLQNNGKTFTYDHTYFGDGREKSVTAFGDANGNSVSTYDANKIQIRVDLGQGDGQTRPEFKTFVADNEGHIIYETHDDGKSAQNETDQFLYANGNPVGQNTRGTDGKLTVQLDQQSYAPVQNLSDSNPGANLTYTVQNGDTLQSIANQMYGNPSLWFVIADANGLSAGETLKAGTILLIPNSIQTGTITSDNHKVYSQSEIVGSTLPNLKTPPPPHHGGCGSILAIIIVVVIAIVAVIATAGLAGVFLGAGAAAASTAATVAAYAAAGIIVGAVASVVQQGLFIALGYQSKFSWKDVAAGAVAGGFAGAAAGVGQVASLAAKAGTLTEVGAEYAKVAEAALDVGKVASQQLIENGKITSWTGLATAAVGGYASASQQIAGAQLAAAQAAGQSAQTAAQAAQATQAATAAKTAYESASQLSSIVDYVSPWAQLAETYARNDKLTPGDWAGAVGSTLSKAVTDNFGDNSNTLGARLQNASLSLGTSAIVAGALSHYDKNAAESYIDNAIGQVVGSFFKPEIETGVGKLFEASATPSAAISADAAATASTTAPQASSSSVVGYDDSDNVAVDANGNAVGPTARAAAGTTSADLSGSSSQSEGSAGAAENTASSQQTAAPAQPVSYTVKRGDTLSGILGTSDPAQIGLVMALNGLTNSTIHPGQTLQLGDLGNYDDDLVGKLQQLGQAVLTQDNARVAAYQARIAAQQAQAAQQAAIVEVATVDPTIVTSPADPAPQQPSTASTSGNNSWVPQEGVGGATAGVAAGGYRFVANTLSGLWGLAKTTYQAADYIVTGDQSAKAGFDRVVQTAEAAGQLVNDSVDSYAYAITGDAKYKAGYDANEARGDAIVSAAQGLYQKFQAGNAYEKSATITEGVLTIASMFVGAGEARAAGEAGAVIDAVDTANVVHTAGEVNTVARDAEIANEAATAGAAISHTGEAGTAVRAVAEEAEATTSAEAAASAVSGSDAQREALLHAVQDTRTLTEAKGVVYGFRRMQELGYDLIDQSFQYGGESGHGLDLVFQHSVSGEYAILEAKAGEGLGSLTTSNGLRQGSELYNQSRLERYIRAANDGLVDNPNPQLAQTILDAARQGDVASYASFYKGQKLYQLNFQSVADFRKVKSAATLIAPPVP
jgi:YD repeat-containing protein